LGLVIPLLGAAPRTASADEGLAAVGRDDQVEVLLRRSVDLADTGKLPEAVKALMLAEDRSRERLRDEPGLRPVFVGEDGVARGVHTEVRRRLLGLGPEALRLYRADRDPMLEEALGVAGDPATALGRLRLAAERYALATRGPEALLRVGDLQLERGELGGAARAYARLADGASDLAEASAGMREAARARLRAVQARAAARSEGGWPTRGGASDRAAAPAEAPAPGSVRFAQQLPSSEVSDAVVRGYERRGLEVPLVYHPVVSGDEVILTDGLTVTALALADGNVRWLYVAADPADPRTEPTPVPERLGAMAYAASVAGGRIFATLNRNTPPLGYEDDEAVLSANWRLVALDARRQGRLVWDASGESALGDVSRRALHVSAPLAVDGRVLYTIAMPEGGGVHAYLLALDARDGRELYRTFIASASPDNFLASGALPASVAVSDGLAYVQTNIGAVAALEPASGEIVWLARYASHPSVAMKRIVDGGHRFRPGPPRVLGGTVCVAAADAPALIGFDAADGRERWRITRGGLEHVVGVSRGRLVVAGGGRALSLDPQSGRAVWRADLGGARLRGAGVAADSSIVLPAADRFVVLDATTGERDPRPHRYAAGQAWAGNLLVVGGDVLSATRSGLVCFAGLEASRRTLREQLGARQGDATTLLAAADLLARLGEDERALAALSRVVADGAGSRAGAALDAASEAAARAVALGAEAFRQRLQAGDRAGAIALGSEAFALGRAEPDAAALGRDVADALVSAGRIEEAVGVYARMVRVQGALELEVASGVYAPIAPWVRRRLVDLRARGDVGEAFRAFDDEALAAGGEARRAGTPDALGAVVERWPTSPAEARALLLLADLYEARGLGNASIDELTRFLERFPADERGAAVSLRRVRLLGDARRYDELEVALVAAIDRYGEASLPQGGSLAGWAEERLAELRARFELPALPGGTGGRDRIGLSFHTRTDLTEEEPRVLTPRGYSPRAADAFLLAGDGAIESRALRTGALNWRRELTGGLRTERVAVADGVLVLFHGALIDGVDLGSGELRWRVDQEGLGRLAVGGDPAGQPARPAGGATPEGGEAGEAPEPEVDVLAPFAGPEVLLGGGVAGDRVVLVLRNPEGGTVVTGLAGATGAPVWRYAHDEVLQGDPLEVPDAEDGARLAVVVGESPARLVAVRAGDGEVVYDLELGGRSPSLTTRPQGSGRSARLFAVVAGNILVGIDAARGEVSWRQRLGYWPRELVPAPDGQAVAVLPYGVGRHPALVVFDGRSGAALFEERDEAGRASHVAFGGEDLYVLSGDFRNNRLRAIAWRSGTERWSWSPSRGNAFRSIELSRDHVLLAQTGPSGPGVVYAVERERGRLFHTFHCGGRRLVSAGVFPGTLVVSTNRGAVGFSAQEPGALRTELAALAEALASEPGDAEARVSYADRLFKLGRVRRAVEVLERGLDREDVGLGAYDRMHRLLLGYREVEPPGPQLDVTALSHPPGIDGELNDWWRVEQSFDVGGARSVSPVQGGDGVAVLRGRDDLSAVLYLGYDARFFYFALDVDDSSLVPYDSEAEEWKGDCLLIAIDSLGNGGDYFMRDDNLLSLALTLPKKNKDPEEAEEEEEGEPEGKYFVKRKDDGSGATYEVAIPWSSFAERNADVDPETGPRPGFTFGLNIVVTDDDDGSGARKALSWTPSMGLHRNKQKLWQGFVPGRFARVTCK
jgi:outer membrane protein assembly factor BamB